MTVHIGDVLVGTVSGIQPYGAFVALDDTTQGLIHISECRHGYVKNVRDILHVGQEVHVKVLDVDEYSQKISLSLRAMTRDPFTGTRVRTKHYWTNHHVDAGFAPIHNAVPGWLKQAEKDFSA
ncbi:CvfD/Ygs/GSP13 family RNA-binding post-transcriptional regulator [Schleiferilactobacillus shenzhenensis]|nr:CvfD/Ygs/GSP13 family RNA-binding post-transcriptional regulator [Schleiferilactobacillus shenzhenensis]